MKEIYTASKKETKTFSFSNKGVQQLIVSVNGIEFDNVELAGVKDNCRVLEIELNKGDVVSVNENKNISYGF